ncbi:MAG: HlyC/CorC family transporter [Candidatus Kapabacteria bacterium]|nr:HlyC/CorC family transporter [Candidatus Kapabacteria bacterium]
MIGDIALTMFFVILNGFFVAAEFAMVKVRTSQIEIRAREGNMFAGVARHILEHLDAYLSACQLGITLASLGLGWIGESVVANLVAQAAVALNITLSAEVLHTVSLIIAFSIITVLHIVVGEIAPKSYAIRRPESVTLAVAIPMRAFYAVFRPVVGALNWMSNAMLSVAGIKHAGEHDVHSPEELRYLIAESSKQGALEVSEQELIDNVFEFTETTAAQVMVPRSKITAIDIATPVDLMLDSVMTEGYSRLPVYRGTIDTIVGIIYAKDLLTLMHHRDLVIVQDILHAPYLVQEDVKLKRLLRDMQRDKVHMAVVLDEFGGTAGLLTLEDIIEELVGNIQDEYDDETPMHAQQSQGSFELDAAIRIDEANEFLPEPLPESDDYETLGGLINVRAGRIPAVGDVVVIDGYSCTILSASPRRVERVRISMRVAET